MSHRHPAARWTVHAAAYLALLVALLGLVDRHDSWNFDDGAYAIQVAVLRDGHGGSSWAYPYRHADRDPASLFAPVSHSTVTSEGSFPYVKQPVWVEAMRATTAGADGLGDATWGLYLPSILGAVAAALVAGVLASRLAPDQPAAHAAAFWVVALGPLVVHAQALWAHSAAAALGGAAALGLVALAQGRGRWWHAAGMAAAVGGLVLLRAEGALFAVALATVAGGVAGWDRRRVEGAGAGSVALAAATWSTPLVLAAAVARVGNGRWATALAPGTAVDGPVDLGPQVGFLVGRYHGMLRTFVDGVGTSREGTALALLAGALALAAGLVARRRPGRPLVVLGLLGLAVVLLVLRTSTAPYDMGGFVAGAPVAVAGLAAWRWRTAPLAERALVGLAALHALAVLATQYPEGGSRDWGGRYLFPVLVPVTVLATTTLWARLTEAPAASPVGSTAGSSTEGDWLPARVALAALLVVALVPTFAGLRSAANARASFRSLTDLTLSVDEPTIVRIPRYATRTSWRALPGPDWLTADVDHAADALAMLRPGRTEPVAVVGNGADRVRAPGWRRDVRSPRIVVFTPT